MWASSAQPAGRNHHASCPSDRGCCHRRGVCGGVHVAVRLPAGPAAAASMPLTDQTVPAQLQFTAKTVDGQDFSGHSLLGEPAVLWFWAPWCPVCQGEAPMVGRIAAAHPSVTFVGVAGLDQLPAMQQFVAKYPVSNFTHLADTD